LKTQDFTSLYEHDALIRTIAEYLKIPENNRLFIKNAVGSLDCLIAVALHKHLPQKHQLIVAQDREEAQYFHYDLQNLFGKEKEILLFPTSYKRPYHYEEVENANILMRSEVLSKVNHKADVGEIIITYPEALSEKVINKKTLLEHTFSTQVGETLDTNFISEMLIEYDFEKTEFVYEAGQFAIRGGILDIFSFANELPYRIELLGDEVESIRTFDVETQLSIQQVEKISIIPNTQTRLLQETRESFLDFLPQNTLILLKNTLLTLEVIEKCFEKVQNSFEDILKMSNQTQVISDPEVLFETKNSFKKNLEKFMLVEIGKSSAFKSAQVIEYNSSPQPSFNKEFHLLVENLNENHAKGFTNLIASESLKQTERLRTIFEELDPHLQVQFVPVSFREGFLDKNLRIACYTDHQIFERFYRYKTKTKYGKSKALTLKEIKELKPGDYVTHIDYGIGRFAGLEKFQIGEKIQETVRLIYKDDDVLYVNMQALHKISKYSGKEGTAPAMSKLGSQEWENKKNRVKSKVKDIAKELILLYAKRKAAPGFRFGQDDYMQAELESSFLYEDTPDQAKATNDVKNDMEQPHPMDRLVCGDVGFGKTEIAIRAAFKAVCNGKQVAVLVPTTILAMQHYRTFAERLAKFPCKVAYINRFKSNKDIKATLEQASRGEVDILIGTHRILNQDVKFKDLGLMIIDEEQKFGVTAKEKLKQVRVNVDSLTLTATPIPRTLHFSLMGARDLSIIATPPPNRQPVTTEMHTFNQDFIRDAVSFELKRGGQVFFVHNRVADLEGIGNMILKIVPDARIGIAHGQMDGAALEKTMMKFIEGDYDILISTNIIESGLDIPNANTIIINHSHMFGLSDLHQMRGRVGRSNKKAFCYLLIPSLASLSSDSRKRLQALEQFSDLGDGFKVAMRDLDIRGAGDLLGAEQSGFISDLGFDAYHKILDEAVNELKETEFKELFQKDIGIDKKFVTDCIIETDFQMLIPEKYITSISERLGLYNQLDNVKDEQELKLFQESLKDRFGELPKEVLDLIETVKLRWIAEKIGLERLTLKAGAMKGFFPAKDDYYQSDNFGKVIQFIASGQKNVRLKEINKKQLIIFEEVRSLPKAMELLGKLLTD
jgi:transcription-repair coupling factor (superfamily II helicase)